MAEPVQRMERAFFEWLALVRLGGDSIRRSMAASSFYAAVEAVRAKNNGGSNRTAVKKVLLRAESRLPRGGFFLFCRRADFVIYSTNGVISNYFSKSIASVNALSEYTLPATSAHTPRNLNPASCASLIKVSFVKYVFQI